MRKFLKFISSRFFILSLLLFSQIVFIILFSIYLAQASYGAYIILSFYILDILGIIFIANSQSAGAYKLAWTTCIALLPIGGGFILWLLFANKRTTKRQKRKTGMYRDSLAKYSHEDSSMSLLKTVDSRAYSQARYIFNCGQTSPYTNTEVEYFKLGEDAWPKMIEALKNAQHFIFLEYFIIEDGVFWGQILDILKEKAKNGIDVRLIYDDFGCMSKIPYYYNQYLNGLGIKCFVFNRYLPILTLKMNNRDHRKLMIIDGIIGFTGGINLADEYVNQVKKFGNEWKDNCIMLKGSGIFGMTSLFLSQWCNITKVMEDFNNFSYEKYKDLLGEINPSGFVQTFGDIPYDYESIGENVYLNMIYKSSKYIYICSPYLVPDDTMIAALKSCARSGIDVRIVIPGAPDKLITYQLTLSYLPILISSGVKVYRYNDAFIHGKMFLSDDDYATIGTINLDLRSLYLHMENATLLYKCSCLKNIKSDFEYMFKNSTEYTLNDYKKTNILVKAFRAVIRLFAAMF